MRRPHVFERSAPRSGREAFAEPTHQKSTAQIIAAHIGNLIDKAEQAGFGPLADLLEAARLEAEAIAASAASGGDQPKPIGPATEAMERMEADIAKDRTRGRS